MLTVERLREFLRYDPLTGSFTWLKKKGANTVGKVVETISAQGYPVVCIDGTKTCHRLAWLYMTGEQPKGDIDHINGDKEDNRFANLRDVPRAINCQNRRAAQVGTATGVLGVKRNGKGFAASIFVDGRAKHLGTFKTVDMAQAEYVKAKREFHAGCTI